MYDVRADFDQALRLANSRLIYFRGTPSNEVLSAATRDILISEKGYPDNTMVHIDGSDPMAMVLVIDDDGSWELV